MIYLQIKLAQFLGFRTVQAGEFTGNSYKLHTQYIHKYLPISFFGRL